MDTKRPMRKVLVVILTAAAFIGFMLGFHFAEARSFEIKDFIDERECKPMHTCYATLVVICSSGAEVSIHLERKRLNMLDIDSLYALIISECNKQ